MNIIASSGPDVSSIRIGTRGRGLVAPPRVCSFRKHKKMD